jgi:hypothetical protein
VSSTKPTMLSLWLFGLAIRIRGAFYITYRSIESGQPWQHPFGGERVEKYDRRI